METWQKLRLDRARQQDISVTQVDCTASGQALGTDDSTFVFSVQGVSGDYLVEVDENVDMWPPWCDCEDNCWRPDILCKHILLVLALIGVDERNLRDCSWEPATQQELYEYLSNAPDCVGCTISRQDSSATDSLT